jgi:signal transduction histidine kinase
MLTETKKSFSATGKMANVAAACEGGQRSAANQHQASASRTASDRNVSIDPFHSGRQIPIHIASTNPQEQPAAPPRSFIAGQQPSHHAVPHTADRSAFIAGLAIGLGHDIGNIVLPMLCYLDSLDSLHLPDDARSHIKALRESAMHLKRLSSGLNLFAHDSGDWSATAPHTHLQSWWREIQPIARKSLPRLIMLKTEIDADLPPVNCPAHQLTQAILNIISNAGEAIAGRGTVRVAAQRGENNTVLLSVADSGRGMSEDVRNRALDPFFTTKKRSLSTGLGLTQVNDIATAAGGKVIIDSAAGKGTTVTLVLPQAHAETAASPSQATHRSAALDMRDARIASYARTLLEGAGFNVHHDQQPGEDDALIVVQGGDDAMRRAREFVHGRPNRRAIVLSSNTQPAPEPGVVVIDQSHRALQRELQHAARDLS